MRRPLSLTIITLSACSAPGGPYPSLQPRAAEAIDPRVEVVRPINDRPVASALASKLATLVDQARTGDAAFGPAIDAAEGAAAHAGTAQSEGWIAAQEALSGAIAARSPTALALSDIDALAADALQTRGGIASADLKAIESASNEVAGIAGRQSERIDAVQRRLGL